MRCEAGREIVLNILIACQTRISFHLGSDADFGLGGIETASLELARALARRGHRIVLATRTDQVREADGVRNIPLESLPAEPCDALITSNDAAVFDRHHGATTKVLWLHNPLAFEKAVRRFQLGAFWRHRPHAVFVGTVAEREMTRLFPFRSRRVIPHGLSATFRETPLGAERAPRFVWASQRQRGLAPTLDAWKTYVAPAAGEAELHVFGTVASDMRLSEVEAGQHRVVFHSTVRKSELARFYATAYAMFYPGARDETFCLAAAEAQAMGLPVVTLGIGALAERVQHGVNGLVAFDYRGFANSALRLLHDPELWDMLNRGALLQRDILTWDRTAKLWEDLLLELRDLDSRDR